MILVGLLNPVPLWLLFCSYILFEQFAAPTDLNLWISIHVGKIKGCLLLVAHGPEIINLMLQEIKDIVGPTLIRHPF